MDFYHVICEMKDYQYVSMPHVLKKKKKKKKNF